MTGNVGWSTLDVIPTVKNLRSQLEKQTNADFAAAGRKGGQQFGDAAAREAGGRFKSKFSPILKSAFAPAAGIVAGAGIVSLFKGAIQGASDLAESGNKVQVIFGDATDEVERFASKGAKAFGQTKLEILNAAASFGVFGKAAGLSGSGLADFSDELAGLSTDLASFFNTSPAQAVEAIGAGLRGESEPLRQFGVLLDDATLRQEALRLGLVKTTSQALTPQQRVLAAYNVILKQTKDAQGDFERTSGGLANQQRILSAQWSEMSTELGSKLLPAATATVRTFNDGVLPALESTGGAVSDAAHAFVDLPAPIKAATGALVAFNVARAVGLTGAAASGLRSTTSGLETLRLRTMLAADEYRNLRSATLQATDTAHVFSGEVGRSASALGALKVGAQGAGAGLRRGLSGALGLVGGPWGAAFIAGTAVLTHFWQEQQKAKAFVDSLTASLDEQTGALTKQGKTDVIKKLFDEKVLTRAKAFGLSVEAVTNAALGSAPAIAQVRAELDKYVAGFEGDRTVQLKAGEAAENLFGKITSTTGAIADARAKWNLLSEAEGKGAKATDAAATATGKAAGTTQTYASALSTAKDKIQQLLEKENERRNANLGSRRDEIALQQAIFNARREAFDGAKGLNIATEEGRANKSALLDLADQWNNTADSVKNAKGAQMEVRVAFLQTAIQMGATKTEAKKLADQLLDIPKNKAIDITTPGMQQALEDAAKLKADLESARLSARNIAFAQGAKNRDELSDIHRAGGGSIFGPGTGTSDSVLLWGSNGEFMQRKAAVDYYGVDFMRRLNSLQVPKFAGGGSVGSSGTSSHHPGGQELTGILRIDGGTAFLQGVTRAAAEAAQTNAANARRMSSSDGIQRNG